MGGWGVEGAGDASDVWRDQTGCCVCGSVFTQALRFAFFSFLVTFGHFYSQSNSFLATQFSAYLLSPLYPPMFFFRFFIGHLDLGFLLRHEA